MDQELRDKIIETSRDVKHIRERLDEGRRTFREHSERIRKVEQNQQFMIGKMTIVIMGLGALMLFLANFIAGIIKIR